MIRKWPTLAGVMVTARPGRSDRTCEALSLRVLPMSGAWRPVPTSRHDHVESSSRPYRSVGGDGSLRVERRELPLELFIRASKTGPLLDDRPELLVPCELPDVYAVIAHYLNHREPIAEYTKARRAKIVEAPRGLCRNNGI